MERCARCAACLVAAMAARRHARRGVVVPGENVEEALAVEGLRVAGATTLREVVERVADPGWFATGASPDAGGARGEDVDLAEVRGQPEARRALEIAAAGRHNLLFVGPPGTGKTMLARRLPSVLPPLASAASLEATMIHSVAGTLGPGGRPVVVPPFRAPHHTVSDMGLVGGGNPPRPGESQPRAPRRALPRRAPRVSVAPRWKRCASRWKTGGSRSRVRPGKPCFRRACSWLPR